ncbi:MAG TPA: alpha/beta hydrolase [Gaiellaceae bacterium]|nr:alpha/beta hydrolase [Gaiellaceae bacterium]
MAAAPTWLEALRGLDPAFDLGEAAPGVTVADLLALHDRVEPPAGFRYDPAVVYDGGERTLHLYAPVAPAAARPGVLFVHGGGWAGGCPTWHLRQACALAERGYVAASATYRLAPAHRWPAALEDVRAAVGWLRANAAGLGLDPQRLAIAGGSAGGHLAALAALEPELGLAGAILWYPAVDLRHFVGIEIGRSALADLFGGPPSDEQLDAASPTRLVHAGSPPVLTLAGELDGLTPVSTAEEFHRRLTAAGVENRLVVYPGKHHQFDLYPGGWEDSFAETVAFLERTVGPGRPG